MTSNVLFVGRQPDKYAPLWRHLLLSQVRVAFAASMQRAPRELEDAMADVILVDSTSLRGSGDSLARHLRRLAPAAHLILIAETDVMTGLSYDYLLPADVHWHRVLKVIEHALESGRRQVLVVGPFVLDLVERTVVSPVGETSLTTKLFSLLELFMRNPGKTVTRLQIMQDVWHTSFMEDTRTLDVHMSWLRRAIEPNPRQPVHLRTRRGVGYTFYPNGAADKATPQEPDTAERDDTDQQAD
ncbi:MAG: response regulator transcription factor [Anaerolineae bacterium]|nr:response regulator transcription factor [Anaerolineae bacterium]